MGASVSLHAAWGALVDMRRRPSGDWGTEARRRTVHDDGTWDNDALVLEADYVLEAGRGTSKACRLVIPLHALVFGRTSVWTSWDDRSGLFQPGPRPWDQVALHEWKFSEDDQENWMEGMGTEGVEWAAYRMLRDHGYTSADMLPGQISSMACHDAAVRLTRLYRMVAHPDGSRETWDQVFLVDVKAADSLDDARHSLESSRLHEVMDGVDALNRQGMTAPPAASPSTPIRS